MKGPDNTRSNILSNFVVKGHGIEASYITVHSYDILVINTRPWTCTVIFITNT